MEKLTKIILKKISEDKAYFAASSGEEIILPKYLLPDNSHLGKVLYLKVAEKLEEKQLSADQAKLLLEDILNP